MRWGSGQRHNDKDVPGHGVHQKGTWDFEVAGAVVWDEEPLITSFGTCR